jgi:CRP/FNR family transcriptional regulator, cyclic AMP receptor protein
MKVLHNLKIQNRCSDCPFHAEGNGFFCNLPASVLQTFESLKITNSYPKGATLFNEGQSSHGIYMLCQGRVKLSTCSRDGKVIILRIAEAGEILGLSATVSDSSYETTAEALEPCQLNFVRKQDFMRFLQQNPEASLSVAKQLSRTYHKAYSQIRSFGLSQCAGDRLAKLLLDWSEAKPSGNGGVHLRMTFTHEEIAEMIGTSRETVSRLLKDFRERKLISLKGSDLYIHDRARLQINGEF